MKYAHALANLRALCQAGLAADALVPAVLEALHGLVPSDRNLFDWTDAEGRLLRYYIEGPIDVALAQLYFDEFHNQREAEAMPAFAALCQQPAGVRGPDGLDAPAFFRTALYNEIWRPQGFHTRLEAVLRDRQGQLLGSLVLYRGPADPAFTAAERQRLSGVLPLLAQALQAGSAATGAAGDEPHVPSPEPPESLLLRPDGHVCHASDGAMRLLMMADGGASRDTLSRPLPLLGRSLLQRVLGCLGVGGLGTGGLGTGDTTGALTSRPAAPAVVSHTNAAGRFVATGRVLRPLAGQGAEPLVQLTVQRHEPQRVALERALRNLPITPGQAAVCRALYHGRPQADIAQTLGVAPTTVVDHVRKAYRVLDLHSAAELRTLLNARMARHQASALA